MGSEELGGAIFELALIEIAVDARLEGARVQVPQLRLAYLAMPEQYTVALLVVVGGRQLDQPDHYSMGTWGCATR